MRRQGGRGGVRVDTRYLVYIFPLLSSPLWLSLSLDPKGVGGRVYIRVQVSVASVARLLTTIGVGVVGGQATATILYHPEIPPTISD